MSLVVFLPLNNLIMQYIYYGKVIWPEMLLNLVIQMDCILLKIFIMTYVLWSKQMVKCYDPVRELLEY